MIIESNSYTVSKKALLDNLFTKEKHSQSFNQRLLGNILLSSILNFHNSSNKKNIRLNKDDVVSIMDDSTDILISIIGASTVKEGISHLVESILDIDKCPKLYSSIIIHFNLTSKYKLIDISKCMNIIYDVMDEDISGGFSISVDDSIDNIKINALLGY